MLDFKRILIIAIGILLIIAIIWVVYLFINNKEIGKNEIGYRREILRIKLSMAMWIKNSNN